MLFLVKVSVIIPAYNVESYIERCLTSIVNQSLEEVEIIIINDGSTDNTLNVINKFCSFDNRIKIINSKNSGVSAARNYGLSQSTGKYIFQIDADDWIETNALKEMYEAAEESNADIVIANAYVDYDNGKMVPLIDGKLTCDDPLKDFLIGNIIPCVWTKLYRRSLFISNNIGYCEKVRIGEDLLANFFLILHAKKIMKIEKFFLHYIQRQGSAMNSYRESMYDIYIVLNKIEEFLKKNNLYEKYKNEFLYLKYMHTYYYRVVMFSNLSSIHKDFYNNWKKEKDCYLGNNYISEFLMREKYRNRVLEKLYRTNYFLGLTFGILKKLLR
ncbi:glycosyltransferase family 2 protein [Parageobacillus thermoglucosidasius]|uniref:glycosyltransferase family 2 protein n=1 Tax=Parageobacillus thermoglucosidasius TaxID=1426 RepID=UPI001E3A3E74|nr:glycosyltransferase family 2 protein [Parageobacillus thermoglucosidasius]